MWARVSRYQFPAAEIERVVDALNAAMASFANQPGLARADVLVSRKSGAGITITVWDTAEAMKASEEEADRLREDVALELIGWVQSVEEYEVVRTT
jgi:heme-degrading monooxygenase HmoA